MIWNFKLKGILGKKSYDYSTYSSSTAVEKMEVILKEWFFCFFLLNFLVNAGIPAFTLVFGADEGAFILISTFIEVFAHTRVGAAHVFAFFQRFLNFN